LYTAESELDGAYIARVNEVEVPEHTVLFEGCELMLVGVKATPLCARRVESEEKRTL
jgi:hypothetical protein